MDNIHSKCRDTTHVCPVGERIHARARTRLDISLMSKADARDSMASSDPITKNTVACVVVAFDTLTGLASPNHSADLRFSQRCMQANVTESGSKLQGADPRRARL
eukprot:354819-Chlamydomonas_euryale.AAC.3